MVVELSAGIGAYGKLWTGTQLHPAHENPKTTRWDGQKAVHNIVDAIILERPGIYVKMRVGAFTFNQEYAIPA